MYKGSVVHKICNGWAYQSSLVYEFFDGTWIFFGEKAGIGGINDKTAIEKNSGVFK